MLLNSLLSREYIAAVFLVLVFVCASASNVQGQTAKPAEYQVKAAYLYNFGKFIQWPPQPEEAKDEPFGICVWGQDPLVSALEVLASQTINGHSVITRQISKAQDVKNCKVLFVSASEKGRVSNILAVLEKFPVLTVSDMPHFLKQGGMIQFVVQNKKVRFEVNRTATERAGLIPNSELLKLAVNMKVSP
ncbi:MAG TPA: YfiR family protein [Terriglobales bacterium]|nr:YfiR family protein [Terriglobales bacterium]